MKSRTVCMIAALCAAAMTSSGCMSVYAAGSDFIVTDQALATKAAGQLGVMPNEVAVSDRRVADGVTYYTATVRNVAHICHIVGGGVLSYGVSSGATCVRRQ